jgi:hypothetical protein
LLTDWAAPLDVAEGELGKCSKFLSFLLLPNLLLASFGSGLSSLFDGLFCRFLLGPCVRERVFKWFEVRKIVFVRQCFSLFNPARCLREPTICLPTKGA